MLTLERSQAAARLSDDAVVEQVRAGEPALFEVLMRRHNERVFRIARAVSGDSDEAEDVLQEAYVRAWRRLDQYRGGDRFAAWLSQIVLREALARGRKARATPSDEAARAASSSAAGPADAAGRAELVGLLEEAVDALPEAYRLVVALRDMQGLSVADTAASLGISEGNVKVRHHRARAALRERLLERAHEGVRAAYGFHLRRCDRLAAAVLARIGAEPPPA